MDRLNKTINTLNIVNKLLPTIWYIISLPFNIIYIYNNNNNINISKMGNMCEKNDSQNGRTSSLQMLEKLNFDSPSK